MHYILGSQEWHDGQYMRSCQDAHYQAIKSNMNTWRAFIETSSHGANSAKIRQFPADRCTPSAAASFRYACICSDHQQVPRPDLLGSGPALICHISDL